MPDKAKEQFVVKHEGGDYDIKHFLKYHPGGTNMVAPFKNLDIGNKLAQYDHSTAAMYLMKEYKLDSTKTPSTEPEDLEKLVDWNKPMLDQVGLLGDKYYQWVSSPVDRKLRLFESDILEALTVTPWFLVPLIWIPAAIAFGYHGYFHQNAEGISPPTVGVVLVLGFIFWTLLEYSLHRWLFHRKPNPDSPRQIVMHFTIHGLHHKVPFDDRRLLFPPFPAFLVIATLYTAFWSVLPAWLPSLIAAGALSGYVFYDLTHFYLHYGSPEPESYFYHMKRYHNRHHFTHPDVGFGISNDMWDKVFGTEISLNKLKQALKW